MDLRCIECLLMRSRKEQPPANTTAVTVYRGDALCTVHLAVRLVENEKKPG